MTTIESVSFSPPARPPDVRRRRGAAAAAVLAALAGGAACLALAGGSALTWTALAALALLAAAGATSAGVAWTGAGQGWRGLAALLWAAAAAAAWVHGGQDTLVAAGFFLIPPLAVLALGGRAGEAFDAAVIAALALAVCLGSLLARGAGLGIDPAGLAAAMGTPRWLLLLAGAAGAVGFALAALSWRDSTAERAKLHGVGGDFAAQDRLIAASRRSWDAFAPAANAAAAPPAAANGVENADDWRTRAEAAEAALARRLDQDAARTQYFAEASHELRTPLNAIIGMSDAMRAGVFGPLPPRYVDYAGMIHESGQHMLQLVNSVLDLSKIEAGRYELSLQPTDLRDPAQDAVRLLAEQAKRVGVALLARAPDAPLVVQADPQALRQIVLNLVSNSLKFTPTGGAVIVDCASVGDAAVLRVADSGVGMNAAQLDKLGVAYESGAALPGRGPGTGLGLALVRRLVELHGGALSADSSPGDGTTITVVLPHAGARPESDA